MITIEGNMKMFKCQQVKDAVDRNMSGYISFVENTLNNAEIERAAASLLPFDNFITMRLRFVDDSSQIKSLSISILRMEMESATFSLGVGIDIAEGKYNIGFSQTMFMMAFYTLEELRSFTKSPDFYNQALEIFESQIDECFYPKEIKKN